MGIEARLCAVSPPATAPRQRLCSHLLSSPPGPCLAFTRLCPQVLPQRLQGSQAPGQPARAAQPSDHSYALLDLDALKKKLFLTLKENEKLRKRLKAQRLLIRRMSSRLRAHRAGQPGLQARLRPEQQS